MTVGPISGVHSKSQDKSVKSFMGATTYNAWLFTADIIPIAPTAPGEIIPSLNSRWVGRPFPQDVQPPGGSGLEEAPEEIEEDERDERRRRRRGRRGRRTG